jgi:hypothetical protein
MARGTKQQPLANEEAPRSRPRRKKRGRITLVASIVFAYVDLFFIMVGVGATVQLWTAPGSSLVWKLLLPVLTIGGVVLAIAQFRSRPRDQFAGLLRAEFVLTIAGVLILGALAAAPN